MHILFVNAVLSSFITKSFPYSDDLSNNVHFIKHNYLIWMNLIFIMYSIYASWLFIIHHSNSLPWTKTKKRNKTFFSFSLILFFSRFCSLSFHFRFYKYQTWPKPLLSADSNNLSSKLLKSLRNTTKLLYFPLLLYFIYQHSLYSPD